MLYKKEILSWNQVSDNDIDNFVNNHSEGLIYYKTNFVKFLENILGAVSISIAFKRNHIIEAILPLLLKKGKYGNVINSLPFLDLMEVSYQQMLKQKNIYLNIIIRCY